MAHKLEELVNKIGVQGPVVTIVMDGVGIAADGAGNAVKNAYTPTLDMLMEKYPWVKLQAHGKAVGLMSDDDMGNSEVGHNALGSGQVFAQGAKLVTESIESGRIFEGKTWCELVDNAKANNSTLHFIGLFSDGNVHSHINHLREMIKRAKTDGVKKVRVHVLLDGRDVGETSALEYVRPFEEFIAGLRDSDFDVMIASGGGRMQITMDRYEANWKMVENGWKVFTRKDLAEGRSVEECDLIMVGDYTLGLWLTHPDEEKLLRLRDELMALDEVGMIFSQPKEHACIEDIEGRVPGTFSEALIFSDHARGPDIRVTMRNNPQKGKLIMGASLAIGAGNHGGLLPAEIQSLLAIQGDRFSSSELTHTEPAGHDDFALTVMKLMGLTDSANALMPLPDARVLTEAIGGKEKMDSEEEVLTMQHGHFIQYIQRIRFGKHLYVCEGARAGICKIKELN